MASLKGCDRIPTDEQVFSGLTHLTICPARITRSQQAYRLQFVCAQTLSWDLEDYTQWFGCKSRASLALCRAKRPIDLPRTTANTSRPGRPLKCAHDRPSKFASRAMSSDSNVMPYSTHYRLVTICPSKRTTTQSERASSRLSVSRDGKG